MRAESASQRSDAERETAAELAALRAEAVTLRVQLAAEKAQSAEAARAPAAETVPGAHLARSFRQARNFCGN